MDVLEELKKTRLMVLARGVQKDVLLKAALSVLALMPAENVQAFDSLTTRWTFGAHEPITMYRRKGVRTTGGIEGSSKWVASWLDWFDTESPKLMKELGLNWCHCRLYKGMGWEFEKRDFPNVKRFVDAAHANGVGTLAYIQFMTLYYENMLAEIPNLRDWAARDHEGNMMYYYGGGYYRWVPCISCDEWIDYLVPIMRFAVTEGGFDGVMFDNAFSRHCYCERCQRKFREHLAKLPNAAERFGFDDLRFVLIPPESALAAAEIKDALARGRARLPRHPRERHPGGRGAHGPLGRPFGRGGREAPVALAGRAGIHAGADRGCRRFSLFRRGGHYLGRGDPHRQRHRRLPARLQQELDTERSLQRQILGEEAMKVLLAGSIKA